MTLAVVAPTIASRNVLVYCLSFQLNVLISLLSFQLHEHYDDLGGGGTDDSLAQCVSVLFVLPAVGTLQ